MTLNRNCRHCGNQLTLSLADLGMSPIANDYVSKEDYSKLEPFYPLHAWVCSSCRLVQIEDFLQSDKLFREDYAYFSSISTSWVEHAKTYVEMMIKRFNLGSDSQFIEIASNDGYLLQSAKACGVKTFGVEPCRSVAEAAMEKGIETHIGFFDAELGNQLKSEGRSADAMAANNVLAHVPDINGFVAGFKAILKPQGVATFEQQHLLQLMQNNQFDTIYHEHYSYLSLIAAKRLFAAAELRIFDVEHIPTHGGSLRLFVCHEKASHKTTKAVANTEAAEFEYGLDDDAVYKAWANKVRETKRKLLSMLINLKSQGKTIAAYGAPAKGNTLLNYCGIGRDFIDFTVDLAPSKQDKYLPGSRIPIFTANKIMEEKPDFILILPWNLKTEIMNQLTDIRKYGGRFIVPIPEPKIIA